VRSERLDYRQKQGEKGRLSTEKPVAKVLPDALLCIISLRAGSEFGPV
jgi:hypothetical protein